MSTASIQVAKLSDDGLLGPFEASGSLAVARCGATAEVIHDHVYVFGGASSQGGTPLASVERAAIHDDGSLGAFETVPGLNLITARQNFASLYTGPYVYLLGGNFPPTTTVERAAVHQDGSLGAFEVDSGVQLSTPRWAFAGTRIGDRYYAIGGENTGGALTSIEGAPIDADGRLGTFSAVESTLPVPRNRSTAIALAGRLCLLGGWSGSMLTRVDGAAIDASGSLGAFSAIDSSLVVGVEHGSGLLTSKAVYYLGGHGGAVTSIIQKADLQ